MKINFILNKQPVSLEVDPLKRLLDVLREDFGLMGSKEGCGEGECGLCTIIYDNKPVTSCIMNAIHADGKKILTVEGVAEETLGKLVIDCMDETNAVQCGICFPGFVVSSYYYLVNDGEPDLEKIKVALSGNICRCTGYKKIFESVLLACQRKQERGL